MPSKTISTADKSAVREIQAGFRMLVRGIRKLVMEVRKHAEKSSRSRRRSSPGRRIHGQYIGLIRNLPAKQKAKVRAIRAKKGVKAAIRMAREIRRAA